jgi:plastocyanin
MVLALVCAIVAFSSVSALASPRGKRVKVGDNYFRPGKLTVKKGTKVTW